MELVLSEALFSEERLDKACELRLMSRMRFRGSSSGSEQGSSRALILANLSKVCGCCDRAV
ncbi:hypothetical protein [Streptomyces sp. NPDC090022]|uniref:hypothetical protein n=1 Tax=Streptomyces sp. NPDC090022 TaxID=3365920 RepID=UPI003802E35B